MKTAEERRLQNLVQALQDAARDEQAADYTQDIRIRIEDVKRATAAIERELIEQELLTQ